MSTLVAFIAELSVIVGVIVPIVVAIVHQMNGMKCLLRSEMLHIYYSNKDNDTIRQYELENFVALYGAYRTLKGNSFIEKIHKEVMSWEVIT
jgi:hypothetical protein